MMVKYPGITPLSLVTQCTKVTRKNKVKKSKNSYLCQPRKHCNTHTVSGCSSAWLEYSSGGRGVVSSNLTIPTEKVKTAAKI